MTNGINVTEAKARYDKLIKQLEKRLFEPGAPREQIEEAIADVENTFTDTLINSLAERGQDLGKLAEKLEKVIEGVRVNPIGEALDEISSVINEANELLNENEEGGSSGTDTGEPHA